IPPVPDSGKPGPKPLSQWERMRRELRGEKVDSPEDKSQRENANLADTVLRVLAENGRHFSSLPGNEVITVSMTLRPMQACAQCHSQLGWEKKPEDVDPYNTERARLVGKVLSPGGSPGPKTDPEQQPDSHVSQVEATNFAVLGDLRLKQGRAEAA